MTDQMDQMQRMAALDQGWTLLVDRFGELDEHGRQALCRAAINNVQRAPFADLEVSPAEWAFCYFATLLATAMNEVVARHQERMQEVDHG